jgi:DNA-binding transcriptional ArsR family regulator
LPAASSRRPPDPRYRTPRREVGRYALARQRLAGRPEGVGTRGSQKNISGHLACLKDCGLVIDRAEGRHVFYRIAGPEVVRVLRSAESLLASTGCRIDLNSNYRTPRQRSS